MKQGTCSETYTRQLTLASSQCDFNGLWKLSSLMETIQDVANEHCKALHVGRDDLAIKGVAWVLFKTDVQIERYPVIGETVTVQTFTKGCQYKFFPRYFVIKDEKGAIIGKVGALWMLMDKITRKSVSSEECGIELPNIAILDTPIKISTIQKRVEGMEQTSVYKPQYSDIDVNLHVNNTRYVDWLCNNLGLEIMKVFEIEFVSIDYNYEVLPNTVLDNSLILGKNEFRFSGFSEDICSFSIYGRLRAKIK